MLWHMQRVVLFGLVWLAVTTAAVGVAWAGVQIVSTRVVEPLPPEALALASGSSEAPDPSPTAGGPTVAATPSPRATPGSGSAGSPAPAAASPATPSPSPAATAEPPEDTSGAGGTTPRADPPEDAGGDQAAGELRSYRVAGGSVTLRFAPGVVTVVAAVPRNDDFDLDLEGNGTEAVVVEFESDDQRSRVRGWWDGGPRDRVDDDPGSSSGPGSGDDRGDDDDRDDDDDDDDG